MVTLHVDDVDSKDDDVDVVVVVINGGTDMCANIRLLVVIEDVCGDDDEEEVELDWLCAIGKWTVAGVRLDEKGAPLACAVVVDEDEDDEAGLNGDDQRAPSGLLLLLFDGEGECC